MKKNGEYVGVDEKYIPEGEKYVDDSINSEVKDTINKGINSAKDYISDEENKEKIKQKGKKGLKIIKGVGIGYLIFFCLVFITVITIFVIVMINIFKFNNDSVDFKNNATQMIDKAKEKMKDQYSTYEKNSYNNDLEAYIGTKNGSQISLLLDKVVTKIKKEKSHTLTVVYNDKSTSDTNEIINLKNSFDEMTKYEVTLDYDDDGFVNLVTILDK